MNSKECPSLEIARAAIAVLAKGRVPDPEKHAASFKTLHAAGQEVHRLRAKVAPKLPAPIIPRQAAPVAKPVVEKRPLPPRELSAAEFNKLDVHSRIDFAALRGSRILDGGGVEEKKTPKPTGLAAAIAAHRKSNGQAGLPVYPLAVNHRQK